MHDHDLARRTTEAEGGPGSARPAAHPADACNLRHLPVSVIIATADGRIAAANPAAERLLGYARNELIGQPVLRLHDAEELQRCAAEMAQQLGVAPPDGFQLMLAVASRHGAEEREWTYLCKDGAAVPVNLALNVLHEDDGAVGSVVMVASDITRRKRAEAYIRHMAHYDALTGLPNRTLLLDRLDMAIRQARRRGERLAVLMLDLDHFKRINDTLGHHTGDQLLRGVGRRLQDCVRAADTVARFGGDEFVVVLPDVGGGAGIEALVESVARAVDRPLTVDQRDLMVTPSIGACLFPDDGDEATQLLRHADTAMYQAKSRGRGSTCWFHRDMLHQAEERLTLGNALRRAVERQELSIHYQPELSLQDGTVLGMEALLRWRHGAGMVSPERFVPVAEETGLIVQLGDWVLRNACRQCAQLQRELGVSLRLAVNVSPRQFQSGDLCAAVAAALRDGGLDPHCLELEVTEGVLMQDPQASAELLAAIRRLGVTVVIDDFGTGYSSLSYLTRFPVDKIKIDRSFVRGLAADSADAAVVNAIIAMAHSLDMRVVAEGVETPAQRDYLRLRGCDQAQGYYYSKAVPPAEFVAFVAGRAA